MTLMYTIYIFRVIIFDIVEPFSVTDKYYLAFKKSCVYENLITCTKVIFDFYDFIVAMTILWYFNYFAKKIRKQMNIRE